MEKYKANNNHVNPNNGKLCNVVYIRDMVIYDSFCKGTQPSRCTLDNTLNKVMKLLEGIDNNTIQMCGRSGTTNCLDVYFLK